MGKKKRLRKTKSANKRCKKIVELFSVVLGRALIMVIQMNKSQIDIASSKINHEPGCVVSHHESKEFVRPIAETNEALNTLRNATIDTIEDRKNLEQSFAESLNNLGGGEKWQL